MPVGEYPRLSGEKLAERLDALKRAQSLSLPSKIKMAEKVIDETSKNGPLVIMFSGGRDSVTVATLAKPKNPKLLYCDTTISTVAARERVERAAEILDLELVVVTPEMHAFDMWKKYGHYPIGPKRGHTYLKKATGIKCSPVQCTYHQKEKPALEYIKNNDVGGILWGNRASDSNRRKLGIAEFGLVRPPDSRWPVWSSQPIAMFTDVDVAQIAGRTGLDFTSRSEDGCQYCCTDLARRDNQLARTFVNNRAGFEKAMRSGLGAQILKARGEAHADADVEDAILNNPERFLRIPSIGKRRSKIIGLKNGRSD